MVLLYIQSRSNKYPSMTLIYSNLNSSPSHVITPQLLITLLYKIFKTFNTITLDLSSFLGLFGLLWVLSYWLKTRGEGLSTDTSYHIRRIQRRNRNLQSSAWKDWKRSCSVVITSQMIFIFNRKATHLEEYLASQC